MAYTMSKLTRIIIQLSDKEYKQLYQLLVESDALKSADLLKVLREEKLEEKAILQHLAVSKSAYYALRSRLNNRIESFYLEQLESGKNELYSQVANINELILTKSRTVAIASLKNLEKELASNDLFHELTLVYQALKKLHINTPEHFQYSQLYNKHSAQLLALEKTETLTAEYFKTYNQGLLEVTPNASEEVKLIRDSIEAINNRYNSHRILVLKSISFLFCNIINLKKKNTVISTRFAELDKLFKLHSNDLLYRHLSVIVTYLKFLNAYFLNETTVVEKYMKELDPISCRLLTNYSSLCPPVYYLLVKLKYAIKNDTIEALEKTNEELYRNYDDDSAYVLSNTVYYFYRAHCCFYSGLVEEALKWLEKAMAILNIKEHEQLLVDLKLTSAGFSFIINDYDAALNQLNYVQRILRISKKSNFEYAYSFMKTIKVTFSAIDFDKKERKFESAKKKFIESEKPFQSPLYFFDISKIQCTN